MTNFKYLTRVWIAAAALATPLVATTACVFDEGPFEEAGEEIDDAADEVEDELE